MDWELWVCFEVMRQTVLLTDLAVVTLPTVAADALVHADFVNAGASIAAWVTLTVVDVWRIKKKNDEKNARLRMRFCKSQPHISRIVASCILCCVCGIWSYSRGSKCL